MACPEVWVIPLVRMYPVIRGRLCCGVMTLVACAARGGPLAVAAANEYGMVCTTVHQTSGMVGSTHSGTAIVRGFIVEWQRSELYIDRTSCTIYQ